MLCYLRNPTNTCIVHLTVSIYHKSFSVTNVLSDIRTTVIECSQVKYNVMKE